MSLAVTCLWIAFLWLVIYAVKYSRRRPKFLLPSSHTRRPTTEVIVKYLNIRLKTQAFNAFHDKVSARLSSNDSRTLRQILLRLYDLGSFIGIIGMLVGFCLLFFTVASSSSELLRTGRDGHHSTSTSTLTKRALHHGDITVPTAPPSNALSINPIVSLPLRVRGDSITSTAQIH
ncbi:hypothetical protein JVT61DRAFT_1603 [Boletus reticuloceps]|uniref:Uncharacterized protein n=1 Tax=Boletus reticuloceps TaxID=495285 RepID=A0A8I2YDM2_9AGAM|nr:hypothetical protein JVT61DRAFT_13308 [Boletus reticuloceps]KAG6376620.1 hypothetical protein JVT61DRAFT_1603 [Boletus reticuloceps]